MDISFAYFRDCFIYALIGAAVVLPLLVINVRIAPRLGLIDWPKARGVTEEQIPIIGHSLVIVSIAVFLLLMAYYPISPWFLTTAIIMALMGHFDDRKPVPALDKMFFQVVCVVAVVLLDPQLHTAITVRYGTAGTVWAMFFILGLMNAVNFIDGIDGLAGIILAVGCIGFLLFARTFTDQYPYVIYASVLLGMTAPFLVFNVGYRRGFLGNVGSYFFSYVLAVLHLSLPIDASGPISRMSISGLCFLIPVADAIMVITTRSLTLRSPFKPDKGHFHHRLIQTTLPLRYILLNFGIIELSTVLVAYLLFTDPGMRHSILPIVFGVSQIGIVSLLILLSEKASRQRVQGYFQRLDIGEPIYFLKYRFTCADGSIVKMHTLRRLEARVCSEIRVSDLCYAEKPDTLLVTVRASSEPLPGISSRLDQIFQSEGVSATVAIVQGQFVKSVDEARRVPLPKRRIA